MAGSRAIADNRRLSATVGLPRNGERKHGRAGLQTAISGQGRTDQGPAAAPSPASWNRRSGARPTAKCFAFGAGTGARDFGHAGSNGDVPLRQIVIAASPASWNRRSGARPTAKCFAFGAGTGARDFGHAGSNG